MKRYILIESDTKFYSMFAYPVEQLTGENSNLFLKKDDYVAMDSNDGKFFGLVRSLLTNRADIEKPSPIKLVPPSEPTSVVAEQLAAVDRATKTAYNDPQPEGLDMVPERVEEWIAAPAADEDGQ